ncbi:AraC family transcriptional regulator (plasmid) [Tistrella mobilis]|uniref:helix-turn-helix domain-containing protein n=1 Tax=Tistrella mobilis TaxID=171437 RepID=UPI00355842A5
METVTAAGLEIYLYRSRIRQGECWSSVVAPGLWLGTLAAGRVAVGGAGEADEPAAPADWVPGMAARFWAARGFESRHTARADGTIAGVFLRVLPEAVEDLLGPDGARLAGGAGREAASVPVSMGLVWRMLGTTGTGTARRLHLTAAALHLLGHVVEAGDAGGTGSGRDAVARSPGDVVLSPGDIERLHAARDLLLRDLAAPPPVPDLARAVGLNARKLGRGFQALFGSPVYAFVKNRRLDEARRLIEDEGLSIAEAAWRVGYSPAHFSTAFRKRHGLPPGAACGRR